MLPTEKKTNHRKKEKKIEVASNVLDLRGPHEAELEDAIEDLLAGFLGTGGGGVRRVVVFLLFPLELQCAFCRTPTLGMVNTLSLWTSL